jgi:hypothetical protein
MSQSGFRRFPDKQEVPVSVILRARLASSSKQQQQAAAASSSSKQQQQEAAARASSAFVQDTAYEFTHHVCIYIYI